MAAPPGSAWSRAAAGPPTATSTGWPAWSARSRRSTPTSRSARASGCSRTGRPSGCATAGVDAYNHNINTAESHHDEIVTSHTYADRVETVTKAKDAGLSPCSGLIAGLGETDEQLVEALLALRDLGSDSIPVNFLMPFDGTPLEGTWDLTPGRCLRILAMARIVCPDKEIRIAGGREMHLRSLQGLALHVANSIFLGDYLTSEGQAAEADLELIRDNGFVVLGADDGATGPRPEADSTHDPAKRRRGAGTGRARQCLTRSGSPLGARDRGLVWHPYAPLDGPEPYAVERRFGRPPEPARRRRASGSRPSTRWPRGGARSTATATPSSTRRPTSSSTGSATSCSAA